VNSESRQRELIQQDINEQHHQINPRYVGEKDECRDSLIHLKGPKYYH
jgi:choline kinase